MDLSIIIINWMSTAFTRRCLASIYANADATITFEVIVVDNASFDGCDGMIKAEFPQVVFLQSEDNLGFARANNLAFSRAVGRDILFLNPDTEIQGKAIQTLLASLASLPEAGMVGAKLLNSDYSLQRTCVAALPSILNQALASNYLRRIFPRWQMWGMRALLETSRQPIAVEAISGACMLGRYPVFKQVGCFSTDFFMYSEDMDLCLKIEKGGWKIFYVPDAEIVHHAAGSSSLREETNFSSIMLRESLARFMQMHRGSRYATLYRASVGFTAVVRLVLLLAALPIGVVPRGRQFLSRAFSKWSGIFAWSLGFKEWATREQRTMSMPIIVSKPNSFRR